MPEASSPNFSPADGQSIPIHVGHDAGKKRFTRVDPHEYAAYRHGVGTRSPLPHPLPFSVSWYTLHLLFKHSSASFIVVLFEEHDTESKRRDRKRKRGRKKTGEKRSGNCHQMGN